MFESKCYIVISRLTVWEIFSPCLAHVLAASLFLYLIHYCKTSLCTYLSHLRLGLVSYPDYFLERIYSDHVQRDHYPLTRRGKGLGTRLGLDTHCSVLIFFRLRGVLRLLLSQSWRVGVATYEEGRGCVVGECLAGIWEGWLETVGTNLAVKLCQPSHDQGCLNRHNHSMQRRTQHASAVSVCRYPCLPLQLYWSRDFKVQFLCRWARGCMSHIEGGTALHSMVYIQDNTIQDMRKNTLYSTKKN